MAATSGAMTIASAALACACFSRAVTEQPIGRWRPIVRGVDRVRTAGRPSALFTGAGRRLPGPWLSIAAAAAGAGLGILLGAWPVALVGAGLGGAVPGLLSGRAARRRRDLLEGQLGELAEATSVAVRSGFSVTQALAFAGEEVPEPMSGLVRSCQDQQRVGLSFEQALARLGEQVGGGDADLLVMVISMHHRTGGNVARALEEVSKTIRYRVALRRELGTLTAQGRMSGAILGALPVGFLVVLSLVSGDQLTPVFGSPAGIAMIVTGLALEAAGYLWVRHILKVRL